MIWIIAWKNVWRNRLRSLVVIFAVIFGLIAGVFTSGLMNGMIARRINSAIENEVSHIQIHNVEYLENNDLSASIDKASRIVDQLKSDSLIRSACRRMKISGMANTASSGTGVMIYGIEPENEKTVSTIFKMIPDSMGSYFESNKKYPIVISQKMAEKLKAKLKSKIVVTVQTTDGHITGGAFKVVGIFKTKNSVFDEMCVFAQFDDLASLTGFNTENAHEIAMMLHNENDLDNVMTKLKQDYTNLSIMGWKEIQPDVGIMVDYLDISLYIFVLIILLALGFGIVNTMLMVVLERVKEIGMLMAVGMNKLRIFKMILLETIYLVLTGGVIGMIAGAVIIEITSRTGINFGQYSEGLEKYGYDAVIYPSIGLDYYLTVTLLVIFTGIVASLYPAKKALKLNPADAIRTEM